MPQKISAGLLMYRLRNGFLQVFLSHPGGPLYAYKDDGYWSIPKGEPPPGEELLDAAIREFEEETGIEPRGPYVALGSIRQKGGKVVHAWAFEGDHEEAHPIRSNSFEMEWPPHSGKIQSFPEVDRACFLSLPDARLKLRESQWPLVENLAAILANRQKGMGEK
jgi:predicted NUDIX family NTP pyrophosphohydrolase